MTERAAHQTSSAPEPPALVTAEDLLAYWVPVPEADRLPDVLAWATAAAADMATERAIEDPDTVERLRVMLALLAQEALPEQVTWRLLFMVDPAQGGVVYDVAFVAADGNQPVGHLEIIRAGDEPAFGGTTRAFPVPGGEGASCLRVLRADGQGADAVPGAPEDGEVSIIGRVAAAARRSLPGLGDVDVVASAETVFLEALLVSLPSVEALLGGEALAQMVQATATNSKSLRSSGG